MTESDRQEFPSDLDIDESCGHDETFEDQFKEYEKSGFKQHESRVHERLNKEYQEF